MGIMCLGIQTIKINQKYVKSLLAIQAIQVKKELLLFLKRRSLFK